MAKKELTKKEKDIRNKKQRDRRANKKVEKETTGGKKAPAKVSDKIQEEREEKKRKRALRKERNGGIKRRKGLGTMGQLQNDAALLREIADKLDKFYEAFSALSNK